MLNKKLYEEKLRKSMEYEEKALDGWFELYKEKMEINRLYGKAMIFIQENYPKVYAELCRELSTKETKEVK